MKFNRHHPHLINGAIQAQQVLLFGPDKTPLGTKSLKDSLFAARQLGLDLILIAPKATPPGMSHWELREIPVRAQKKDHHQKAARLKEIQLSANIFEHDLETKVRHAKEFAAEGHPVKVVLRLRGREKAHPEIGRRQMQHFLTLACGPGNHPIQTRVAHSSRSLKHKPRKQERPPDEKRGPFLLFYSLAGLRHACDLRLSRRGRLGLAPLRATFWRVQFLGAFPVIGTEQTEAVPSWPTTSTSSVIATAASLGLPCAYPAPC